MHKKSSPGTNIEIRLNGLSGKSGRCGWICRALRNVSDFVSKIPIVGYGLSLKITAAADVMANIDTLIQYGNDDPGWTHKKSGTVVDYEPTTSENNILEQWKNNKFLPFYSKLATDLATAFQQQTLAAQLIKVNQVRNKMCIVATYFNNNETTGLSQKAIQLRTDFISYSFEPLFTMIEDSFYDHDLIEQDMNVSLSNLTINQYSPLINTANGMSLICKNYIDIPGDSNHVAPLVITNTSPAIELAPVATSSSNKSNDNTSLWIGIFVAGVLAISLFTGKNDEERKEK